MNIKNIDSKKIYIVFYIKHIMRVLNSYWYPGEFILKNNSIIYNPDSTKFTNNDHHLIFQAFKRLEAKLTCNFGLLNSDERAFYGLILELDYISNDTIVNKILLGGLNFDVEKILGIISLK